MHHFGVHEAVLNRSGAGDPPLSIRSSSHTLGLAHFIPVTTKTGV